MNPAAMPYMPPQGAENNYMGNMNGDHTANVGMPNFAPASPIPTPGPFVPEEHFNPMYYMPRPPFAPPVAPHFPAPLPWPMLPQPHTADANNNIFMPPNAFMSREPMVYNSPPGLPLAGPGPNTDLMGFPVAGGFPPIHPDLFIPQLHARQIKTKQLRKHALEIIDPRTNKSIFENVDIDRNTTPDNTPSGSQSTSESDKSDTPSQDTAQEKTEQVIDAPLNEGISSNDTEPQQEEQLIHKAQEENDSLSMPNDKSVSQIENEESNTGELAAALLEPTIAKQLIDNDNDEITATSSTTTEETNGTSSGANDINKSNKPNKTNNNNKNRKAHEKKAQKKKQKALSPNNGKATQEKKKEEVVDGEKKEEVVDGKLGTANKQTEDNSLPIMTPAKQNLSSQQQDNPTCTDQTENASASGTDKSELSSEKRNYTCEQLKNLREATASLLKPNIKESLYSALYKIPSLALQENIPRRKNIADGNREELNNGYQNGREEKSVINVNISLNEDVKLNEAENAWRPRMLAQAADTEIEQLTRRVRGILNKLTPEKFEPLAEEVIGLNIDTTQKMEAVMILVFEKAVEEQKFSTSYATLCQRLSTEMKANDKKVVESGAKGNLAKFHKALLTKAQHEFTQNVTQNKTKEQILAPIKEMLTNCKTDNEKAEFRELLEEKERKLRQRSGGTVRFIGELFKLSMLTGNIINICIEELLKEPCNEDKLEFLCKLLTTVGQQFEQTKINKKSNNKYSLDGVIKRMKNIAGKKSNSKISSRVRFMLLDVIDLRNSNWQSSRNETPKTMEQIEKDIINEKRKTAYESFFPHKQNGYGRPGNSQQQQTETGNNHASNNASWFTKTGKASRSSFA